MAPPFASPCLSSGRSSVAARRVLKTSDRDHIGHAQHSKSTGKSQTKAGILGSQLPAAATLLSVPVRRMRQHPWATRPLDRAEFACEDWIIQVIEAARDDGVPAGDVDGKLLRRHVDRRTDTARLQRNTFDRSADAMVGPTGRARARGSAGKLKPSDPFRSSIPRAETLQGFPTTRVR
jgi:hypothetical protein